MHLSYRPKFLPRDRESGAARVRRRLALAARTPFASGPEAWPEPYLAPAALVAEDPRRPYIPGPVLAAGPNVVLFRDSPAGSWPRDREPAAPPRPRPMALRIFLLQVALLAAALAFGAVLPHGVGQ